MSSSLKRIWAIFRKEVKDNLRDRRSVISSLISGLLGPAMMVLLILIVGRSVNRNILETTQLVPVRGMEHAPGLINFMQSNGFLVHPAPENFQDAIRSGTFDVILVIPEGYEEDFINGRPARVQVVADNSRQSSLGSIERIRAMLAAYNSQIGAQRLLARGIHPQFITPLNIENVNVSTPQSQGMMFLNMMPYFVILVVFLGGMYVIIDTTAGERERGSLEPLLINPVARWEFVVGKLGAAIPFAVATVIFTLVAFAIAFNLLPLEDYIGFRISVDTLVLFLIFLISLPMILLASALQMIIATFTRSFKEAQTYVAFLPLIPAIPGISLAFLPVRPGLWAMLIPTFGQQVLISQLMRSEPVDGVHVLVSTIMTLLVSLVLILLAIRLYEHERILFGSK
jgi:sodium transport system permease protein